MSWHEPRGMEGWAGADSWVTTPAAAIAVSAMHCGVEVGPDTRHILSST